MDFLHPKDSPLQTLVDLMKQHREPDFVIAGIPIYIHQMVRDDEFYVLGNSCVLISKNGHWRTMTREQFEQAITRVINT